VEHATAIPKSFPWRAATLVVGAIAAAELLALVGIGALHLAPNRLVAAQRGTAARHITRPVHAAPAPAAQPLRARTRVHVLILNGNGVQGAASSEAARLRSAGYRIAAAENAQRHDYAQSMVLYVPGWIREARRLAHDAGIRLVAPIDGLRPAALKGSKAVVILGSSA